MIWTLSTSEQICIWLIIIFHCAGMHNKHYHHNQVSSESLLNIVTTNSLHVCAGWPGPNGGTRWAGEPVSQITWASCPATVTVWDALSSMQLRPGGGPDENYHETGALQRRTLRKFATRRDSGRRRWAWKEREHEPSPREGARRVFARARSESAPEAPETRGSPGQFICQPRQLICQPRGPRQLICQPSQLICQDRKSVV